MRIDLRRRGRPEPPRLPSGDVAWIADRRRPFDDHAVGSLVPVVFEAYARVLHPAWGPSDRLEATIRWDAVAAWSGRTIHPLAQWLSISNPRPEAVTVPPFVAPPNANGLQPGRLATLSTILGAHTRTVDDTFIGVWSGHGWPVEAWTGPVELDLDQRSYRVRRGGLALALEIGWHAAGQFVNEPPSLWWPADRAWFVASDPDLDSTYLGGSADLVKALSAEPDLEAWPVAATDLITAASDELND